MDLRTLDMEKYKLDVREMITAQILRSYLQGMPAETALKALGQVVKPRVLVLPTEEKNGHRGAPSLLRTEIEGAKLAALIDIAAGEVRDRLEEELITEEMEKEAVDIREVVLEVLQRIDGQKSVENMSVDFLAFLTDCYRAVKYAGEL